MKYRLYRHPEVEEDLLGIGYAGADWIGNALERMGIGSD